MDFLKDVVPFLTNHWILSSVFGVLLIAFLMNEYFLRFANASTTVTPEKAVQLINHQDAVVIDIRGEPAFMDGHIVNAINVPANHLDKKWTTLQKYQDKPLIVVCNIGQSAIAFARQLREKSFQALVLQGGLQAWKSAGLPVVKK